MVDTPKQFLMNNMRFEFNEVAAKQLTFNGATNSIECWCLMFRKNNKRKRHTPIINGHGRYIETNNQVTITDLINTLNELMPVGCKLSQKQMEACIERIVNRTTTPKIKGSKSNDKLHTERR